MWSWPSIGSYGIPSCITHRPLPTYQISFELQKLFVDGRTYVRTYGVWYTHIYSIRTYIRMVRHRGRLYQVDSEESTQKIKDVLSWQRSLLYITGMGLSVFLFMQLFTKAMQRSYRPWGMKEPLKVMCFGISGKPTRDSISLYNTAGLISKVSEDTVCNSTENYSYQCSTVVWCPPSRDPTNIRINFLLPEIRVFGLSLLMDWTPQRAAAECSLA